MRNVIFRLSKIIDDEIDNVSGALILRKDNTYYLFGKYVIFKEDCTFIVKTPFKKISFGKLKNALCWCILHNANRHYEAKRIYELDLRLSSIDFELLNYKKILPNTTDDVVVIYTNSYQYKIFQRRQTLTRIKEYSDIANRIQRSTFAKTK